MSKQTTTERILDAAIQLTSEKGYAAATTKAIADLAGVNEVTIFRHFGNKQAILKAIIDKFSYGPTLQKTIQFDVTFDLEADLQQFSSKYFDFMLPTKDIILIAFREAGSFPEIKEEIASIPRLLKEQLMGYFKEMKILNKLIDIDEEAVALSFITMNFGLFISYIQLGDLVTDIAVRDRLQTSVSIFSRGLTP